MCRNAVKEAAETWVQVKALEQGGKGKERIYWRYAQFRLCS